MIMRVRRSQNVALLRSQSDYLGDLTLRRTSGQDLGYPTDAGD
jgi:hypothetical protein